MTKITKREQIDNLPLKRNRKKVNIGDIFAMNISENFYIFGQVIVTDIESYDRGIDSLILFYKIKSKDLSIPEEIKDVETIELLINEPFLVNKTLWRSGIIQNIGNTSIPSKIEPFYFKSRMKNGVVDVFGNLLDYYNGNNKLTIYGVTSLGRIIESIRNSYDTCPEWFDIELILLFH